MSKRGIYCVAFGGPARECATRLMDSIRVHLSEIPICFAGSEPMGTEDIFVRQPDSDVGGRRAKLKAYDLTPKNWESVLYLDADTEVCGDIRLYFQLIEDGWEFVITKDPPMRDTMYSFRRPNNLEEMAYTEDKVYTLNTLQLNGGVWSFGRGDKVKKFFQRWLSEWEIHGQRDQGALVRAMYDDPLKVYVLGNQWNTFEHYNKDVETAGLRHYPGRARRWDGLIPGRIDGNVAWGKVRKYENERRNSQQKYRKR